MGRLACKCPSQAQLFGKCPTMGMRVGVPKLHTFCLDVLYTSRGYKVFVEHVFFSDVHVILKLRKQINLYFVLLEFYSKLS